MPSRTANRLLPLLLLTLLLAHPGVARAVQAHLELDVRELRVGESASLRLVVTGGAADTHPELPSVEQLRFTPQRPKSEIVSINFQASRITTYSWSMRATAVGDVSIGPVPITVGGRSLRVAPVSLQIREPTPGDQGPNILEASIDPVPDDLAPGAPVPLWQGQALVYRFSFSHRDNLFGAEWTRPDFEGFDSAPGVEPDTRDYVLQRGQHSYTVHDADVPLRVSQPGELEIAPSVVKAQFPVERTQQRRHRDPFEDFFGGGLMGSLMTETRTEVLASNPVAVRVKPLPEAGRPEAFDGLVGSFEATAELDDGQCRVGDSVTLSITIRGDGVLAGVELPPAPDSEALRVYDDVAEVRAGLVGGRYRSRATLRRALVPTEEGIQTLPPFELAWFDPALEDYVRWELPAMSLEVLPGEAGGAPVVSDFGQPETAAQDAVATLGEDILPIHADADVGDRRFHPASPLPLLLVLLPGAALLVQLGSDLRQRGGQRGQRKKAVRRRLTQLPEDRAARLAALELAFREAAGLALGQPPAAVNPQRLVDGLPEPLGERAAALYRQLEGARFAGLQPGDLEPELTALVDQLLGRVR